MDIEHPELNPTFIFGSLYAQTKQQEEKKVETSLRYRLTSIESEIGDMWKLARARGRSAELEAKKPKEGSSSKKTERRLNPSPTKYPRSDIRDRSTIALPTP